MNWKYLSIIIALAVILGGGVLWLSLGQPGISTSTKMSQSDQDLIRKLFTEKYSRPATMINLVFGQKKGNYTAGELNLEDEAGVVRSWLAAKQAGDWVIVYDGKGIVTCKALEPYNFPLEIVSQCIAEDGSLIEVGEDLEAMMETETQRQSQYIPEIFQTVSETQTTSLVAVDDSHSSGTAYRLVQNGRLYHAVVASLPNPQPGSVYEGWLVQPGPLEFFSTGVMTKQAKGIWLLEYDSKTTYPTYTNVVITQETIIDETPEGHILEGSFN